MDDRQQESKTEDFPMKTDSLIRRSIPLAVMTGFLVLGAGCKNPFVHAGTTRTCRTAGRRAGRAAGASSRARRPADASDIQAKIAAESALNGQNIQVNMANGVATLNGKVDNDASRALAAADSASIDGVRTVVNNLVVAPPQDGEGAATDTEAQGSGPGSSATATSACRRRLLRSRQCKWCLHRRLRLRRRRWQRR